MSAAGSLVGRKRERLAQSPGPKAPAGQKNAAIALERLAAAHAACTRLLTSQTYPNNLSELALALQHILGAKLVVLCESAGVLGATAVAPAHTETRGWLDALDQHHLEGREPTIVTFDLEASDTAPPMSGVLRFVVAPLSTARGQGALWLGFGDQGPASPEELTCISVVSDHLSLLLRQAAMKPTAESRINGTDQLISLAAHELRTPLTPITMLLQSLERKVRAGTSDVETILRARKQVGRLANMISDLLDLSRLREGRLALTPVRLDLGKIAREVAAPFQEADARHRVELTGDTPPMEITTDESRLRSTLISLVDHVAHATPTGGVIEMILERREGLAAVTIRADRPVFGDETSTRVAVVGPPHARPEPVALGVMLAEGVTAHQGGTVSLAPTRANETRAVATFPLSTPAD